MAQRESEASGGVVGRLATLTILIFAGLMVAASMVASRGEDFRSDRAANLRNLASEQVRLNNSLKSEIKKLRTTVEGLQKQQGASQADVPQLDAAALQAATTPVQGPGMRVVLSDAPLTVQPEGVNDNLLVVHQQDIQAVMNALWQGGAEAMTIQGRRVIATTAIKCVGNTVVLKGVPYAPPYVIEAIGDPDALEAALNNSRAVQIYRQYADTYGLGYRQEQVSNIDAPEFTGSLGVALAQPQR